MSGESSRGARVGVAGAVVERRVVGVGVGGQVLGKGGPAPQGMGWGIIGGPKRS